MKKPEQGDIWSGHRVIAHLDMDAFYASVEILDFPEMAEMPLVVGGDSRRGVVSAASYRAREFGIHSAMPIFRAKQLCPGLICRPVRMKRYLEVSRKVMGMLGSFSPLVEQVSVDEAYIDLTGSGKVLGSPSHAAADIRERIFSETSLTCSVGVSTSKLAAKIASDMNKPDGLTVIPPDRVSRFLRSQPIGKIPGVGKKSEKALRDIGVKCLGDIRKLPPDFLKSKFGKGGERLLSIIDGRGTSPVVPWTEPKSISNERTFRRDTRDPEVIRKYLLMLSRMVARRLRKHGFAARTVTLKLKTSDFREISRSSTMERGTMVGREILREAVRMIPEA
ncbi:MAG: DNA polymerase IV, partial [Candidatus Latescibacteria bacterium]|nr:DNA polymerase IV [bacterium]MBD3424834.1 DNA polymerase IV [Candidatus Latescibacterota bacterium]